MILNFTHNLEEKTGSAEEQLDSNRVDAKTIERSRINQIILIGG